MSDARFRTAVLFSLLALTPACAGEGDTESGHALPSVGPPMQPGTEGTAAPSMPTETGQSGAPGTPSQLVPGAAGAGSTPPASDGAMAPTAPTSPTSDDANGPGPDPSTPSMPAGPEDGDPSLPVVSVPGVPCGEHPSLLGLTTTNHTIGGRQVHVAYPCDKHAGAPVIFVLNLHGTMPDETLKGYQVAYFAINNYASSHNIIAVAPKSVVSQWGNGDGGVDRPHLMEVIDWVYTAFADFDIRAMWIAGHSWGAMYSTTFACDAALADKVRGVMLQSGSGRKPACADRLSVLSSAAENDIGPVIDQGGVPASHGCGAQQTNMLGNNVETHWPACNPGFAHANYFMLGKAHADYMDAVVVERIADLMLEARP